MKAGLLSVLFVACIGLGKPTKHKVNKTVTNTVVHNFRFSYLARIRFENEEPRYYGTIIHTEWILATASDVIRGGKYFVRVGGTPNQYIRETSEEVEYKVSHIIIHDNYAKWSKESNDDVALINVEYMDFIADRLDALHLWDEYIKMDQQCECVRSDGKGEERFALQYTQFMSYRACRKFVRRFKPRRKVDEKKDICVKVSDYDCANYYDKWPLVVTPNWQIGIPSTVYRKRRAVVTMYKRVSYYIPWIAKHCEHCVYCEQYPD